MAELDEAETSEKEALLEALKANDYIVARAAVSLGIHETTALRRMKRHGLDAAVLRQNPRLRALRQNRMLPPAPHEPSRQAQEQRANREAGLCSCGKPPDPLPSGKPGKSCATCRERDRNRKRGDAGFRRSTGMEKKDFRVLLKSLE